MISKYDTDKFMFNGKFSILHLLEQKRERMYSLKYYTNLIKGFDKAIRLMKKDGLPHSNIHIRQVIKDCQWEMKKLDLMIHKKFSYFDYRPIKKQLLKDVYYEV